MDKRETIYVPVIIVLLLTFVLSGKLFAEEDMTKPVLELPQVNIAQPEGYEQQVFKQQDVFTEKFSASGQNEAGQEESSGFVNVAYGRFDSSIYDVVHSARTDKFYYSLQVNINNENGERQNSDFKISHPKLKLGIPFDAENELIFKTQYFNKSMGLPGKMDAPTIDSKTKNSDFKISTQVNHAITDGQLSLEPYYGLSVVNPNMMRTDFKNNTVGAKMDIEVDENVFNFDLYQERLINYYEQVIFDAKVRLRPLELNDKWQLVLGTNIFAQEEFGQRPAPFAELIFSDDENCSHKLKFTREFEPLNFSQTYLDANYVEVNPVAMRPRRKSVISYQLDKYISPEWRANFIAYIKQDKDIWFFSDVDNDGLYSPTFIEKVNFGGIKLSTEYNWSEAFSNFLSLNLRRIRSKDTNYEFVPFEPKQKISVGFTYKMDKKFKLDIVGDYFGRRYYQGNSKQSFSGYFLLNSKLTYELKDYLTLFVLVDNLLNDHYEIVKGYPNRSRNTLGGITVKF